MGLPAGGKDFRWPPKEHLGTYLRYQEHSAWFDGSAIALAAFYGGYGGVQFGGQAQGFFGQNLTFPEPQSASSPLWRRYLFWAKQAAAPATRYKMHAPAAADLAVASSDLLFSEEPDFSIPEAQVLGAPAEALQAQDALTDMVEQAEVISTLLEAGEKAAALGGIFLKTGWDTALADHPLLIAQDGDSAVPEFRFGRLIAVTFWRIVQQSSNEVYRWLERHEPGLILHGLYKGDYKNLGKQVSLDLSDYTKGLPPSIETNLPGGRLTAVYIPNMRPNRADRASSLGRSDYAGIESLMDGLDETMSSWLRDIRLGAGRLVAPKDWIRNIGRGQGAEFDVMREVWQEIDAPPTASAGLTINQFAIRAAEHAATAQDLFERIIAGAGYSGSTFGLHNEGPVRTATEIAAREQRSLVTRAKKARYFSRPLAEILETMLWVNNLVFQGPVPFQPRIEFADSVRDDVKELAATAQLMRAAQAASTETLVRLLHQDWGDQEVEEEVKRIEARLPVPALSGGGQEPPLPPGPGGAPPEPGVPPELPKPLSDSQPI